MMVREDEAKSKSCIGPVNCGRKYRGKRFCEASSCMAWRWEYTGKPPEPDVSKGWCCFTEPSVRTPFIGVPGYAK